MNTYTPIHTPNDTEKLDSIIESIRRGKKITPVLVIGEQALTGSHRVRAFELAYEKYRNQEPGWEDTEEPVIPVVEIDEETLTAACQVIGAESVADVVHFDELYAAIERVTDSDEIKSAVADQY
jgi:hypothetical protein